jgi:hypothetical protein
VLATGQVADQTQVLIVIASVPTATNAAERFFWRRCNSNTRTWGFPKTPRTVAAGTNPGNRYASRSFRSRNNFGTRQA